MDIDAILDRAIADRNKATAHTINYEESVADAYRAGASLRLLALRLEMTIEGVRQLLIRRGVEMRRPHAH